VPACLLRSPRLMTVSPAASADHNNPMSRRFARALPSI
jgi:hypothetical protein